MKPVEETLQKSAEVLIALREATKSGKLTQAIRRRADELMVSLSLPTTTPSGLHYGRDVKGEYLAQLDSTKIPSIAIETAISDNEWGEEFVGKTDRNTFIDKVHLIAALPFVDEIVSDDKFFGAIYPVAVTTGHVKAKLINVDQLLKRIEEVEVKPPPEMPCQSGSEENNSCA